MESFSFSRRGFLLTPALLAPAQGPSSADSTRGYWVSMLLKIANPVLDNLSNNRLKETMPVEAHPGTTDRPDYTYLEALGRLLCGMAPWLESTLGDGEEQHYRESAAKLARQAIANAVDPASPDFMNFHEGQQPVVDAAFLALAFLRAPVELWANLDQTTKRHVMDALRSSRVILPGFNNWLLFSAIIEAFFAKAGAEWDRMRVDYALRQLNAWYRGDGLYGDGPQFHWDYYNSFVMHPMLLAIADAVAHQEPAWTALAPTLLERTQRYSAIQERLIGIDGSYPAIGRSLTYRCGAFHLLAEIGRRQKLPEPLSPAQVRCALTAVIRRTMDANGTFDNKGWLRIGLCGHQPSIGEPYISTGSLYLCSAAFLPLGLPPSDPFWSAPDETWTARKIWEGQAAPIDHALGT